jgi:hypothetical protein
MKYSVQCSHFEEENLGGVTEIVKYHLALKKIHHQFGENIFEVQYPNTKMEINHNVIALSY